MENTEKNNQNQKPSQSQRLRAALYILWVHRGKPGEFEEFYNTKMEYFISFVKRKLKEAEENG